MWDLLDDLRDAAADEAIEFFFRETSGDPPDEAKYAAYRLAVCVGRCRLASIRETDDTKRLYRRLNERTAKAALQWLADLVEESRQRINTLEDDIDGSCNDLEADNYCCSLLETRIDAWAVLEAVRQEIAETDRRLFFDVEELVDEFNFELFMVRSLLSSIADLPFLDNWRQLLNVQAMEEVPWFLDETLEIEAERIWEETMATLPPAEVYRELRRQVDRMPRPLPIGSAWPREIFSDRPALALAASDASADRPRYLYWHAPDGAFQASMRIPSSHSVPIPDSIRIEFDTPHDGKAESLVGTPVWLAGVESRIGEDAVADFSSSTVIDQGQDLVLAVGSRDTVWEPSTEPLPLDEQDPAP